MLKDFQVWPVAYSCVKSSLGSSLIFLPPVLRSTNEPTTSNAIAIKGIMPHFPVLIEKLLISIPAVIIALFHAYISHRLRGRISERAQSDFRKSGGRLPFTMNIDCTSIKSCMQMKNNPRGTQIQEPFQRRYFVKAFFLTKNEAVAMVRKASSIAITRSKAASANFSPLDIFIQHLYIADWDRAPRLPIRLRKRGKRAPSAMPSRYGFKILIQGKTPFTTCWCRCPFC